MLKHIQHIIGKLFTLEMLRGTTGTSVEQQCNWIKGMKEGRVIRIWKHGSSSICQICRNCGIYHRLPSQQYAQYSQKFVQYLCQIYWETLDIINSWEYKLSPQNSDTLTWNTLPDSCPSSSWQTCHFWHTTILSSTLLFHCAKTIMKITISFHNNWCRYILVPLNLKMKRRYALRIPKVLLSLQNAFRYHSTREK